jgi:hypothetical protein
MFQEFPQRLRVRYKVDGEWFDEQGQFPAHVAKQVISRVKVSFSEAYRDFQPTVAFGIALGAEIIGGRGLGKKFIYETCDKILSLDVKV